MSKEFENFCNKNWPNGNHYVMDNCHNALKIGWDACKEEILKKLKHINYNIYKLDDFNKILEVIGKF